MNARPAGDLIAVSIPLRLHSAANLREHWARRARRVKAERGAARLILGARPRPPFPVVVTLTRVAPRSLDSDNLVSACKATRDGVADWLGVADNHPSVRWEYAHRSAGAGVYAVEIRIEAMSTPTPEASDAPHPR